MSEEIEIVDNLVSNLPRYSKEREILERLLNSQSIYIQLDENGRIILPLKLRILAISLERFSGYCKYCHAATIKQ